MLDAASVTVGLKVTLFRVNQVSKYAMEPPHILLLDLRKVLNY